MPKIDRLSSIIGFLEVLQEAGGRGRIWTECRCASAIVTSGFMSVFVVRGTRTRIEDVILELHFPRRRLSERQEKGTVPPPSTGQGTQAFLSFDFDSTASHANPFPPMQF